MSDLFFRCTSPHHWDVCLLLTDYVCLEKGARCNKTSRKLTDNQSSYNKGAATSLFTCATHFANHIWVAHHMNWLAEICQPIRRRPRMHPNQDAWGPKTELAIGPKGAETSVPLSNQSAAKTLPSRPFPECHEPSPMCLLKHHGWLLSSPHWMTQTTWAALA